MSLGLGTRDPNGRPLTELRQASLLLGVYAGVALPREEEPQIVVPMVDVFVDLPGASPSEVEQRVTRPLELTAATSLPRNGSTAEPTTSSFVGLLPEDFGVVDGVTVCVPVTSPDVRNVCTIAADLSRCHVYVEFGRKVASSEAFSTSPPRMSSSMLTPGPLSENSGRLMHSPGPKRLSV